MSALILVACYFTQPGVSADCVSFRDEAKDYLAKSNQSCASVIYITLQGTTETVRCRMYDGGILDYVSNNAGEK